MNIALDTRSVTDYARFLRVKGLPKYRISGGFADFPDEYAGVVGVTETPAWREISYEPSSFLFDYQRDISAMAIAKKKYSVFADCGLGKTAIMFEFARHAANATGRRVLIVSPLMVIGQTIEEGGRFYGDSLKIKQVRAKDLAEWLTSGTGIAITNYEAIHDELPDGQLGGLILDESSMLKSHYGSWGTRLIEMGRGVEYKLCLTGTPAPNDRIEYANHAVFMDAYPNVNAFLARFFVNRGNTSERWELKRHALDGFYKALSHWCIFLTNPATYGWKDNCGVLPPIHIHKHDVPLTSAQREAFMDDHGSLFLGGAGGIGERGKIARLGKGFHNGKPIESNKTSYIAGLIAGWSDRESTIVWCKYNQEQDDIAKALPDAYSIDGSTPLEKRLLIIDWFKGKICTCELKRKLSNINGSTTEKTNTSGSQEPKSSKTDTTPSDEPSTPTIQSCSENTENLPSRGRKRIQKKGLPKISERTESALLNTADCLKNSAESAPSASDRLRKSGSTLTTSTSPSESVDCSVQAATSPSDISKTTPASSSQRPCTCGNPVGRILISKARVLGFGLNLQVCTRQVFSGLQDSYEEFYQAVKRSNRYGSKLPLNVHIPFTEYEAPMIDTVLSKAARVASDAAEQERVFREHTQGS